MIDLTKSVTRSTWREKLIRGLWGIIEPVFRWLPKPASFLRIWSLRLFGAQIGESCLIERGVTVLMPWNLRMASYVALGRNVEIYNFGMVSIGRMTVISQYCYICTGTHDYTHPHMPLTWFPISIGSQVWVAAGVFVSPGAKIADGVVVGANSVVTKDLASFGVYAGNPARRIKERIIRDLSIDSNKK